METAVLVLDQVVQGLAVQRRSACPASSISTAHHSSRAFWRCGSKRSKRRVALVLNGVHGPLQWADLQNGGAVCRPERRPMIRSNLSSRWIANDRIDVADWHQAAEARCPLSGRYIGGEPDVGVAQFGREMDP